jgi:hypothetical protein
MKMADNNMNILVVILFFIERIFASLRPCLPVYPPKAWQAGSQ